MTIKEIKRIYTDWNKERFNGKRMFTQSYYINEKGEKEKTVIVVDNDRYMGKYVIGIVRVKDGKQLLPNGACRPCDNLDDACDVADEMETITK